MSIDVFCDDACNFNAEDFKQCDALICDPPYSEHVHKNTTSVGMLGLGYGELGAHRRDLGFGHADAKLRATLALAAANVRRWSCIFSDFESTHIWRADCTRAGAEYIRLIPWVRWSQPQLSGDRPPTGAEAVSIFHQKGRKRWNGPGNLTHFAARCLRGAGKHPTEKPLDLMLDLVSWFSDPGETVLDLCGGSGTTAVACALLGRSCVVVERDARWAEHIKKRITGLLSGRDERRFQEWQERAAREARATPEPIAANGSDVKTYERAQRRLHDAINARDSFARALR